VPVRLARRTACRTTIAIFLAIVAPNLPTAAIAEQTESVSWSSLAELAQKKLSAGDLDDASKDYQQALLLAENQQQIDPGVVTCLSSLSLIQHKLGHFDESERLYELCMRDLEALYGPSSSKFIDWMSDLAWLYDEHGKQDKAEVLLKRVLNSREALYGKDAPAVANSLDTYAKFLRRHQRNSEATILETRAASIRDKQSP
jgi:tetratricopeptide (TPR) repeat protein